MKEQANFPKARDIVNEVRPIRQAPQVVRAPQQRVETPLNNTFTRYSRSCNYL